MSQPAPPEFTQPPFESQQSAPLPAPAPFTASKPQVGGLAIAALVVGGVAFLLGWLAGLGLMLGLGGIVLGILALRAKQSRAFGLTGLILSVIAALTNIAVTIALAVFLSGSIPQFLEDAKTEFITGPPALAHQYVETPCYSFMGPDQYLNTLPESDVTACATRLELRGELTPDGEVLSTGTGAVFGTIEVEPIQVATSDTLAPADTVDAMVKAMSVDYLPAIGTVETLIEPIMLDGVAANLTRIDGAAEFTELAAVITARAPAEYQTANGPVKYFVISLVIADEAGDEFDEEQILTSLIERWTWK